MTEAFERVRKRCYLGRELKEKEVPDVRRAKHIRQRELLRSVNYEKGIN